MTLAGGTEDLIPAMISVLRVKAPIASPELALDDCIGEMVFGHGIGMRPHEQGPHHGQGH
jgi:hypothetical protein